MKGVFDIDGDAVSVEIDDRYVKVAQTGSRKDRNRVTRLIKRTLSSKDDSALSEEIGGIFDSLDISSRKIRLNIPRHLVTVRFLKLPSTDDEEIRKIVKIESLKHVPYADEEVIAGHRIIERLNDGYSNVLIAIAQSEVVERLISILNKARTGAVQSISLGSEALYLWYSAVAAPSEENTLLVNIDLGHIDIAVIEDGKLVFTRGVLYESARASAVEKIAEQIGLSIAAYQKESARTIGRIVVSGSPSKVEEIRALLAKAGSIRVEAIDQTKGIPVAETADIDTKDASFIELIGLCLKNAAIRINLMPEPMDKAARARLLKKNFMVSAALMALIITIAFGFVIKKLRDRAVYLARIDSRLKAITPQVDKIKKMTDDIKTIREEINKKPLAIDILSEVYKVTPKAILLNMLDLERGRALTIRGSASALTDVLTYVNTLEGSLYFESVKIKYANKAVIASKESVDFEISCGISKGK